MLPTALILICLHTMMLYITSSHNTTVQTLLKLLSVCVTVHHLYNTFTATRTCIDIHNVCLNAHS